MITNAKRSTDSYITNNERIVTQYYIKQSKSVLDGWPPGKSGHCDPGSIRRCGVKSVTDRLYSRYRADTDVK